MIVGNGAIENYRHYDRYTAEASLIICADGGAAHMKLLNARPDLLVGDFDSLSGEELEGFRQSGVEIRRYPTRKDATDTEIAVDTAMDMGCLDITLIGVLGSRMDHSLANVWLLKKMLDRGVAGRIVNEHNEIMLTNSVIKLEREQGWKVTLLPLGCRAEGVTTRGLAYPLDNAAIPLGSSWGVSNEFAGETAEVEVKKGLLLIIKSTD